ncbi:TetR/AcrR family transcriptional regulator [Streptomyces sp. NPDC090445]|uniref:TetR/AcrR family transcriptional regulator n=1 Tax=Streptomyces sp. NPDC090445 TaxID=3365963 RepID=UPI00381A306A
MSSKRPRDRRVRRTRRLLQQALLELLDEEPLSKLTISQIAARADVSRQAFYLHFNSKEELLLSHVDDVFDEVRAAALPSPNRRVGVQELLATTFSEWATHSDSLALALQIEDKDHVIERIRLHISDLMQAFDRYGREDTSASPTHEYREYVADFLAGGVYMLLRSWSRDGLTVPAAQMAELVYSFLPVRHQAAQPGHSQAASPVGRPRR